MLPWDRPAGVIEYGHRTVGTIPGDQFVDPHAEGIRDALSELAGLGGLTLTLHVKLMLPTGALTRVRLQLVAASAQALEFLIMP